MTGPITLSRAVEIDRELATLKTRMVALKEERSAILGELNRPGGYEEKTRFGCYRLVPRTRMTPRAIDTDRFIALYPHLALEYGTLRISVTKAEAGLLPEEFAQVVIPGEAVEAEPIIEFEFADAAPEPRIEVAR